MDSVLPLILLGVAISVGGQACLKAGMNRMGAIPSLASKDFFTLPIRVFKQPFILAGMPLYFSAAVVWLIVLSRVELSYAYPFLGLNYVLIVLVSKLFLKEEVNLMRWVGVSLILVGVAIEGRFG